jgi:hypothetical protein
VVCPHQLLASPLAIAQDTRGSRVLLAHTRRGPLASIDRALVGTLTQSELQVPLGQTAEPVTGIQCALLVGSTIIATAVSSERASGAETAQSEAIDVEATPSDTGPLDDAPDSERAPPARGAD